MKEKDVKIIRCTGLQGECRDYIAYPKAIPPYPASDLIVDVKFDRYRHHSGEGDMWPMTWLEDNTILASAGDNKGSRSVRHRRYHFLFSSMKK